MREWDRAAVKGGGGLKVAREGSANGGRKGRAWTSTHALVGLGRLFAALFCASGEVVDPLSPVWVTWLNLGHRWTDEVVQTRGEQRRASESIPRWPEPVQARRPSRCRVCVA